MARGIQAEIKQNQPFPALEEEFFAAMLRTADLLEAAVARVLKPFDLSPTQYNALRILRGSRTEGLACHEIGERMLTHDPDITRLVGRLEKRGLAQRRRSKTDRRVITTSITPAGLDLLKGLDGTMVEAQQRLLGGIGNERLQTMLDMLQQVRDRLA